jgi:L-threonylcarbamoyladenylate synthase
MPLHCDWRTAGHPGDAIRPAVAALQQGGCVVLPTELGYVIAANAEHAEAASRLAASSAGDGHELVTIVEGAIQAEARAGRLSLIGNRLLNRLWPGPVLFRIGTGAPYWASSHPAVACTLLELGGPLTALVPIQSASTEETAAALVKRWGDNVAVVIDAGPRPAQPATWLTLEGERWRVDRPGPVSEADVMLAAATWIVFVCTGNTCRSPMAEALFKAGLAAKLGCEVEELPARGYWALSAGVSACPGDGPSPEAVEVLRDIGADLSGHRSQTLPAEVVAHADHLIAMTRNHLLSVLSRHAIVGGSMRLLCGSQGDLDDPLGGSRELYAACARTILHHVERFIQELVR